MEIMDPMPALLGVVAVLAVTLWGLRKKGMVRLFRSSSRRAARRLESLERLALSPHHMLHLVRLDDRAILVAQSPSGLARIEAAGDPALESPPIALRAAAAERG
ncbi:MAG TPA: flagellar biosynthetic protein FliO [Bryobacteraceae bacterium]|nr:flagellar biosynthetic protein FliO [Bryobacteraceae bacterium]